ncbi:MAG TPA: PDZ domain-containing protein [Chroococcales cyanobacterium]
MTEIQRKFACIALSLCMTLAVSNGFVGGESPFESGAYQARAASSDRGVLKGQVGAFGVLTDELQSKLGFRCSTTQDEDTVVDQVKPGTAAADCGIQAGDRILDAQLDGDALNVTIERQGQFFKARLRDLAAGLEQPTLVAQQAQKDNRPTKPFTLNAAQFAMPDNKLLPENPKTDTPPRIPLNGDRFALKVQKNLRLLSKYNLQLIVDRSASMHKQDCPGGLSRWNWVGQQAFDIAHALAPYAPGGLTIIPFATEFDVFEHASPDNVEYIFHNIGLQSGTRLFEPITEQLDAYLNHHKPGDKPLLIVVITDGVPFPRFEPQMVRDELVQASQKMTSAQEVTVVFFQIGMNDRFGQRYLTDLDQNLVSYGARYPFVHTVLFDESQDLGIGPALIAAVQQYAPQNQPPPGHPAKPGQRVPRPAAKPASRARHA